MQCLEGGEAKALVAVGAGDMVTRRRGRGLAGGWGVVLVAVLRAALIHLFAGQPVDLPPRIADDLDGSLLLDWLRSSSNRLGNVPASTISGGSPGEVVRRHVPARDGPVGLRIDQVDGPAVEFTRLLLGDGHHWSSWSRGS
jgi:hypothetical protein